MFVFQADQLTEEQIAGKWRLFFLAFLVFTQERCLSFKSFLWFIVHFAISHGMSAHLDGSAPKSNVCKYMANNKKPNWGEKIYKKLKKVIITSFGC